MELSNIATSEGMLKAAQEILLSKRLFDIDAEHIGEYLRHKIKENTHGDIIHLPKLVKAMGFKMMFYDSEHDRGAISYDGQDAILYLNKSSNLKEMNVTAAILLSDFILRFNRGIRKEFKLDVFAFKEIHRVKESRLLFLATRLSIPGKVIEDMDKMSFDYLSYSERSNLLLMFVSTVRNNTFVRGFIERDTNFSIIDSLLSAD